MFVRLSTVGEGLADADPVRGPFEPAINLCTEEVSYDLAGNRAPVTFLKTSINLLTRSRTESLINSLINSLIEFLIEFLTSHTPEPRPVPGDTHQPPDAPPATAADRPG